MATKAEIDWPQELERLAGEAEVEALAKADEIFAEAQAEHERGYEPPAITAGTRSAKTT